MSDITGWCDRGWHGSCDGQLRAGTGWHWWCACRCHPEPPDNPVQAKRTWRKARGEQP